MTSLRLFLEHYFISLLLDSLLKTSIWTKHPISYYHKFDLDIPKSIMEEWQIRMYVRAHVCAFLHFYIFPRFPKTYKIISKVDLFSQLSVCSWILGDVGTQFSPKKHKQKLPAKLFSASFIFSNTSNVRSIPITPVTKW